MNEFRFFDAHSHINDSRFDSDREAVLERMKENGVGTLVVGTDRSMSEKAIALAEKSDHLFAAIGLHPTDDEEGEIYDDTLYRQFASNPKVVAIGECGLDYSRIPVENRFEEMRRQKELFEKHIILAVSSDKPLMIHCRDAHKDMLEMLDFAKREHSEKLRGNIHFFSEGPETAKKYFDLDFTISFTGVLTFARDYDEAVKYAPLEKILSETDAPYVAPAPYRGKRNEPTYVSEVVKKIAEIRGEDFETVRKAMVENALRSFGLVG